MLRACLSICLAICFVSFLFGLFVSFLDSLYVAFFKKSTRLKSAHARSSSSSRSTAEIFRFAQIEIQSAFRPPTRTLLAASLPSTSTSLLPAAHLFITVRICGEALTEILAFAVFGNETTRVEVRGGHRLVAFHLREKAAAAAGGTLKLLQGVWHLQLSLDQKYTFSSPFVSLSPPLYRSIPLFDPFRLSQSLLSSVSHSLAVFVAVYLNVFPSFIDLVELYLSFQWRFLTLLSPSHTFPLSLTRLLYVHLYILLIFIYFPLLCRRSYTLYLGIYLYLHFIRLFHQDLIWKPWHSRTY